MPGLQGDSELLRLFFEQLGVMPQLVDDMSAEGLMPQVIAVGMQSAGKSAVLELLTGLKFNFVAPGLGTRVPLRVNTVNDPACQAPAWTIRHVPDVIRRLLPDAAVGPCADICRFVQRANESLGRDGAPEVCSEPITIEARWAQAFNFSFVDYMGFQRAAAGVDRAARDLINSTARAAIEEASRRPNAVILYVESGNADPASWDLQSYLMRDAEATVAVVVNKADVSTFVEGMPPDAERLKTTCARWHGVGEGYFSKVFVVSARMETEQPADAVRQWYGSVLGPAAAAALAAAPGQKVSARDAGLLHEVGRDLEAALEDDAWQRAPAGGVGVGSGSLRAFLRARFLEILDGRWEALLERVNAVLAARTAELNSMRSSTAESFLGGAMPLMATAVQGRFREIYMHENAGMMKLDAITSTFGLPLADEYTAPLSPRLFLARLLGPGAPLRWDLRCARGRTDAKVVYSALDEALGTKPAGLKAGAVPPPPAAGSARGGDGGGGPERAERVDFTYRRCEAIPNPNRCIPMADGTGVGFQSFRRVCSELVASLLVSASGEFPDSEVAERRLLNMASRPGTAGSTSMEELFVQYKEWAWEETGSVDFGVFSERAAASVLYALDACFAEYLDAPDSPVRADMLYELQTRVFRGVKGRVQRLIGEMGPSFVKAFVLEAHTQALAAAQRALPQQGDEDFVDALYNALAERAICKTDSSPGGEWEFLKRVRRVDDRNVRQVVQAFAARAQMEIREALQGAGFSIQTALRAFEPLFPGLVRDEFARAAAEMKAMDLPSDEDMVATAERQVQALQNLVLVMRKLAH